MQRLQAARCLVRKALASPGPCAFLVDVKSVFCGRYYFRPDKTAFFFKKSGKRSNRVLFPPKYVRYDRPVTRNSPDGGMKRSRQYRSSRTNCSQFICLLPSRWVALASRRCMHSTRLSLWTLPDAVVFCRAVCLLDVHVLPSRL